MPVRTANIRNLLKLVFLLIAQGSFAQGYEIVDTKVVTQYQNKSYYVTEDLTLRPGFQIAASESEFFVRPTTYTSQNASGDQNFVRTETILVSGITQEAQIAPLTVDQKTTSFQYVDGLGRSIQKVIVGGSPSGHDVIVPVVFDDFGRQPKEYLPFTQEQSFKGKFVEGAADLQGNGLQRNYYLSPPTGVQPDGSAFSENKFESSPNTVKFGPGQEWDENHGNRSVRTRVTTNGGNEVLYWHYGDTGYPLLYIEGQTEQWSINALYYPSNLLLVNEVIDEENHTKRSYKNFLGQLVMERTGDGFTWHDTYYVYDVTGNLKFVIPPEASAKSEAYKVLTNKQPFADLWMYQYEYDAEGRNAGTKVPGRDWTYFIYDQWDRLVLTQDANQRNSSQWTFTKYDIHNRHVLTGFTSGTRASLTTSAANNTIRYETRSNNLVGYTNVSFPSHTENDLLSITYYDDYAFLGYSNWNGGSGSYAFVPENGFHQSSDAFLTVKGYITGSKIKVVNQGVWLNSVSYYDNRYRTIQTLAKNYLGGIDRVTTQYDFAGKTLKTLQLHNNDANSFSLLNEFEYDHAGRVLTIHQQVDSGPKVLVTANTYNEIGQLIEKNIHSTDNGATFLQSVDHRYNIRGWLTHINNSTLTNDGVNNNDTNDLFGMELIYNQEEFNLNGNAKKLYNGNITAVRWRWNNLEDAPIEKSLKYDYDSWSRLKESYYGQKNSGLWNSALGGYNEQMTYDKNGNIATLNRTGRMGSANQTIDQLGYIYSGNQLINVHDNSGFYSANDKNPDYGFAEVIHDVNITEYEYDDNGNLEGDANKGIELITYNHLNMPERIELENGYVIEYTYDATGNKLRKVAKIGSTEVSRTDYVGSIHYVDNQLAFLLTDEGRVVKRNTGYDYEYFLKDHQGNTRVVFGNFHDTDEFTATLEPERNAEEIADFKNISGTVGYNHTAKNYEVPNPEYAAVLSGSVGPAKIISVKNGDKLHLEAFSRYTGTVSSSKITAAALASAVTSAFQILPSGETQIAHGAVNGGVIGSPAGENPSAPKAYLYYFLFSADYSWYQFGVHPISTNAGLYFEKLSLDFTVNLPGGVTDGFVYTYVANETTGTPVHFDDFKIIHEKAAVSLQVLQASDYYPFGLRINPLGYEKETLDFARTKNNYTFQEQEIQNEFGLDWYQYKYRMHDPAIGRFGGVDPLAEKYYYNSTYAFSENRLTDAVELEGLEAQLGLNWASSYWGGVIAGTEARVSDPSFGDYLSTIIYGGTEIGQGWMNIKTGIERETSSMVHQAMYTGEQIQSSLNSNSGETPYKINQDYQREQSSAREQTYSGMMQSTLSTANMQMMLFSAGLMAETSFFSNYKFVAKLGDGPVGAVPKLIGPAGDAGAMVTSQIPENWIMKSANGPGTRFIDPLNSSNHIRVMRGNPSSPFVNSQTPYVIRYINGAPVDRFRNPISNPLGLYQNKSPDLHVPIELFSFQ